MARREEPAAAEVGKRELRRWRRRSRVWLAVTLALAAVWVSSAWWGCTWISADSCDDAWIGGMGASYFTLTRPPRRHVSARPGFDLVVMSRPNFVWLPHFNRGTWGAGGGVPFWPIVMAAGAMSLRAGLRARRVRRRLSAGLCTKCGYELAGAPAGSAGVVCPECGISGKR